MAKSNFNVLLYSDGSRQSISAAVYAASLINNIPNMKLTILQIHESHERFMGSEFSWIELRRKYKRIYWESESELSWSQTYLKIPDDDWFKRMLNSEEDCGDQYARIVSKTNRIFVESSHSIKHQILYSNINKSDISDTADLILNYSSRNSFNLIIIGLQGFSMFNGLIFGGLAHKVQNKSSIPVLLIKKLPQEFISNFLSDTREENCPIAHMISGRTSNIFF
ncbi:universal stress protein family protein [Desulfosporosinus acididurans]|uniref:Universal stress protein family protein n=1 Tax=Desulfosporosinus acididurans TaxID=476652 RepID=A0A0J1FNY3_9FIRM|nr:universal stress protein [Desulfosporosinus acididurans]KLU65209.1 universal stress protein family protein [Desulfosporosinus acididurans]